MAGGVAEGQVRKDVVTEAGGGWLRPCRGLAGSFGQPHGVKLHLNPCL